MISIGMNGALGRMGTRILGLAHESPKEYKIGAAFEPKGSVYLNKDLGVVLGLGQDLRIMIQELNSKTAKTVDVVIDFSSPSGAVAALRACVEAGRALVIGTTGLDERAIREINKASKKIPILFSPNMSIGANFLFELAHLSAKKLSPGYDIEIVEAHHKLKKDAPSGTAKKIAEEIASAKGWDLKKVSRYGREGVTGERGADELGIHVVRGGDIVGEHTIYFCGPGEVIELKHTALSRDAFAKGALVAAGFLKTKKNGLFSMKDVLK